MAVPLFSCVGALNAHIAIGRDGEFEAFGNHTDLLAIFGAYVFSWFCCLSHQSHHTCCSDRVYWNPCEKILVFENESSFFLGGSTRYEYLSHVSKFSQKLPSKCNQPLCCDNNELLSVELCRSVRSGCIVIPSYIIFVIYGEFVIAMLSFCVS